VFLLRCFLVLWYNLTRVVGNHLASRHTNRPRQSKGEYRPQFAGMMVLSCAKVNRSSAEVRLNLQLSSSQALMECSEEVMRGSSARSVVHFLPLVGVRAG